MIFKTILKPTFVVASLIVLAQFLLITASTFSGLTPLERVYCQGLVLLLLVFFSVFSMAKSQLRLARYIYSAPLIFALVMSVSLVNHLEKSDLPIGNQMIRQDFDVSNYKETQFSNGRIKAKRSFYSEKPIWDEYRISDVGSMRVSYMDGNEPSSKKQHLKVEMPSLAKPEDISVACHVDLKGDESVGEVTLFGANEEKFQLYYKEKDLGWPDSYDPTLGQTEKSHAVCKEMIEVYLEFGTQSF